MRHLLTRKKVTALIPDIRKINILVETGEYRLTTGAKIVYNRDKDRFFLVYYGKNSIGLPSSSH